MWIYYNRTVGLDYDAYDNEVRYGLYLRGNYPRGHTFSEIGRYTIEVTAIDWAGNSSSIITTIQIIDTIPPKVNLNQPPKIIWVPKSQWPNGSYKIPISYPVEVSFDVKDNIAVDDVYLYVDDKFVSKWEDISSFEDLICEVSLSTTTICGWGRHTLNIKSVDLVANTINKIEKII